MVHLNVLFSRDSSNCWISFSKLHFFFSSRLQSFKEMMKSDLVANAISLWLRLAAILIFRSNNLYLRSFGYPDLKARSTSSIAAYKYPSLNNAALLFATARLISRPFFSSFRGPFIIALLNISMASISFPTFTLK